jgi:hypothetical protein
MPRKRGPAHVVAVEATTFDEVFFGDKANEAVRVNVVAGVSGTEYTEGTAQASIVGTAILWEDAADVVRVPSVAKPLPTQISDGTEVAVIDPNGNLAGRHFVPQVVSGNLSGAGQTLEIDTYGATSVTITVIGPDTWQMALAPEATSDGTNWWPTQLTNCNAEDKSQLPVLFPSSTFAWRATVAGAIKFRIRVQNHTSGDGDFVLATGQGRIDSAEPFPTEMLVTIDDGVAIARVRDLPGGGNDALNVAVTYSDGSHFDSFAVAYGTARTSSPLGTTQTTPSE